jgi:hypothetical protein
MRLLLGLLAENDARGQPRRQTAIAAQRDQQPRLGQRIAATIMEAFEGRSTAAGRRLLADALVDELKQRINLVNGRVQFRRQIESTGGDVRMAWVNARPRVKPFTRFGWRVNQLVHARHGSVGPVIINVAQKLIADLNWPLGHERPLRPDDLAFVAFLGFGRLGIELRAGVLLTIDVLMVHIKRA